MQENAKQEIAANTSLICSDCAGFSNINAITLVEGSIMDLEIALLPKKNGLYINKIKGFICCTCEDGKKVEVPTSIIDPAKREIFLISLLNQYGLQSIYKAMIKKFCCIYLIYIINSNMRLVY